ncbi:hypothetical protein COV49_00040 [Candidatus Falkowbacteria bacterium CG11_big_fil_rev_8_21_14_0_20_39_10]|uniref:Uncharacterized protein n=1 Tax=Candidatus Falkowbacteria bacterium CG11_big_fil_rev_8_21_14_0_20_39_10 TaxID=1974570 RepID=A0A2M6KAA2_9BACT|nr:MAG: hypothetical protein COV49_00040 [Candidatus Falkowbacteria bacterium CG11_big_fil_rev_8_21_14_0_20_39_10]
MSKQNDGNITLKELKKNILASVSDSDWEENCYPTSLAKSLVIVTNDLLKEFQYTDSVESWESITNPKSKRRIKQKMSQIFFQLMLFSEVTEIEIIHCVSERRRIELR